MPDCEEIVGQLPSLSLIPQFSTTISEAKLVDSSFSTFFCTDSPIPKPDIKHTLVAMSERTGMSVSQVTDEVLYTGLVEMQELPEHEE